MSATKTKKNISKKVKTKTKKKSSSKKKNITDPQINKHLTRLYSINNATHYRILSYDSKNINKIKNIKKQDSYIYEELNDNENQQDKHYNELAKTYDKYNISKNNKKDKDFLKVKKITEDFTRGVSRYINEHFRLRYPVSNAFMKLWEIYSLVPQIIPNKKKIKSLHFCEAPGNWINCTSNFIITKKNKVEDFEWKANSLNPKNEINKQKYEGIFSDDYGFMKKYPKKWLFGEDGTGDVTKSDNLRWFKKYCDEWKKNGNINFVTGDGGITGDIDILQKLEFGQLCMVLSSCGKGSNCVVKHFLPYMSSDKNTKYSSGFFINYLYIYNLYFREIHLIKPLTSSPNSGEFYIVGLGFKGITNIDYENIISNIDNFQTNQCLFKKNEIPINFSNQIIDFINNLQNVNTKMYVIKIKLVECIKEKSNCNQLTNDNILKDIQKQKFKEWINMYKFQS